MTRSPTSMSAELAPTIDSLFGMVQAKAAAALAAAEADAAGCVDDARSEAAAILTRARSDGDASAARASAAMVNAAGRAGRESVLGAQRRVYAALQQGIHDELARRAGSSAGTAFFARLEAMARARLGAEAKVTPFEDGRIGINATAGKRRVEISADRFIEREIVALGDRFTALWR